MTKVECVRLHVVLSGRSIQQNLSWKQTMSRRSSSQLSCPECHRSMHCCQADRSAEVRETVTVRARWHFTNDIPGRKEARFDATTRPRSVCSSTCKVPSPARQCVPLLPTDPCTAPQPSLCGTYFEQFDSASGVVQREQLVHNVYNCASWFRLHTFGV